MTTTQPDLSLTPSDPLGSEDDLTADIPSRPRLRLPYWVYADARRRVSSGQFRDVADVFESAICVFLVRLGLGTDDWTEAFGGDSAPEEDPPFAPDPDRSDGEETAAREAVEIWAEELFDEAERRRAVSHAKPSDRRRQ